MCTDNLPPLEELSKTHMLLSKFELIH